MEPTTVPIGGTGHLGENKQACFSVLNHFLPGKDVMTMHCSASLSQDAEPEIFATPSMRCAIPLTPVPKALLTSLGGNPKTWSC